MEVEDDPGKLEDWRGAAEVQVKVEECGGAGAYPVCFSELVENKRLIFSRVGKIGEERNTSIQNKGVSARLIFEKFPKM